MSTTRQDKPGGKPRKRGQKADQRRQKPEQQQSPKLDQPDESEISAMVASTDALENDVAAPAEMLLIDEVDVPLAGEVDMPLTGEVDVPLIGEVLPPDVSSTRATAPIDYHPISMQTIVHAYADYSIRSFEESRSLVEKLIAVRSFDQAIEIQTGFARQAYANFVAESQKICELYGELASQIFRPWERLVANVTPAERHIW
jgi:Phasin protein